jgi:hypothetical protein
VCETPLERPHLALLEDGGLVGDDDPRPAETALQRAPVAVVPAGDREMVEVNSDADAGRDRDDGRGIEAGDDGRPERDRPGDREQEVVSGVDGRSPATASPAGGMSVRPPGRAS